MAFDNETAEPDVVQQTLYGKRGRSFRSLADFPRPFVARRARRGSVSNRSVVSAPGPRLS